MPLRTFHPRCGYSAKLGVHLQSTKGCVLNLQRSNAGSGWKSLAETRGRAFGGLLGDNVLKNGVRRALPPKPDRFCSLTSSFNSIIVHICLDYMVCVHGGPIYLETWMIQRAAILAACSHTLCNVHHCSISNGLHMYTHRCTDFTLCAVIYNRINMKSNTTFLLLAKQLFFNQFLFQSIVNFRRLMQKHMPTTAMYTNSSNLL